MQTCLACPHFSPSPTPVNERTGRAVGLRPTVLSLPCVMPLHQQGFDRLPPFAGLQSAIPDTPCYIGSRIEISMCFIATHLTAKRLLVGPIGAIDIMAHAALLGRIGTLDTS